MHILITGVTGFAGGFLAEALLEQADGRMTGVGRESQWPAATRHLTGRMELHGLDLCDNAKIEELLRQFQPEQIYHLAGYAHVGRSFHEPQDAWAGNLHATISLFDAVHRWGGKPRILYVSSGQVYGEPESPDQAFDEHSSLRPSSPYGASKAALHHLSRIWNAELESQGIQVLSLDPGDMDTPLHAIAVPDAGPSELKRPETAARELADAPGNLLSSMHRRPELMPETVVR